MAYLVLRGGTFEVFADAIERHGGRTWPTVESIKVDAEHAAYTSVDFRRGELELVFHPTTRSDSCVTTVAVPRDAAELDACAAEIVEFAEHPQ